MIRVSPSIRIVLAIGLLIFAGVKVLGVAYGLKANTELSLNSYLYFALSFAFFHLLIFPRAMPRNAQYIEAHPEPYPFYLCLRPQTWGIMAVMIGLGLGMRYSGFFSKELIIGFYMGLGTALIASIRYYIGTLRKFLGW